MKKRTRTALTVTGVLVAVGFAGFLAYSAHGRFEGLINGTDDRPVVTPPAGLTPGGAPGTGPQVNGTTATPSQSGLNPPTGQTRVNIGLGQHRGESGEGGGFGEGGE